MAVSDTKLEITPEMLDFGTLASSLEVTLENTSGATLDWSAETGNEWLVLSKSSGTISNLDYLSVIVLRDELSAGDYSSPGKLLRYSASGELLGTYDAGVAPGGFCWY